MSAGNPRTSRQPRGKSATPQVAPPAGGTKSGLISGMASQIAKERSADPEIKRLMIAEAAYYCAEKRGFVPGYELEDWLEAEARVEFELRE